MDKLISADKLLKDPVFCGFYDGKEQHFNLKSVTECIKNAPAVEAISINNIAEFLSDVIRADPCSLLKCEKYFDYGNSFYRNCEHSNTKNCWIIFFKDYINNNNE